MLFIGEFLVLVAAFTVWGKLGLLNCICRRFTRRGRYAFGAAYRLGTGGDRENVRINALAGSHVALRFCLGT